MSIDFYFEDTLFQFGDHMKIKRGELNNPLLSPYKQILDETFDSIE